MAHRRREEPVTSRVWGSSLRGMVACSCLLGLDVRDVTQLRPVQIDGRPCQISVGPSTPKGFIRTPVPELGAVSCKGGALEKSKLPDIRFDSAAATMLPMAKQEHMQSDNAHGSSTSKNSRTLQTAAMSSGRCNVEIILIN
ncbi:hypothetical protein TWF569_007407 [Orbilia oligospora]|uniref:Uncharacterized protein n=1 Tax=Orbilia oligospora TaxID=2813651 RepID=A0A7C8N552_ORBOL|nr:hypothetical protein TWF102_000597 [Orbilia oligospora]KAF3084650.1 hypothetical protein TWF103_002362 [Orbilia oligospora]KAF3090091.1 hypothetical protein TWF706_010234 [Orbilia oligospora]KAF3135666.1 hypothetical protein TWF594_008385 [Orbilia oligospora]KAF3142997.1 hypothetical protein TWF569_007407 [Orbilia oligospora]